MRVSIALLSTGNPVIQDDIGLVMEDPGSEVLFEALSSTIRCPLLPAALLCMGVCACTHGDTVFAVCPRDSGALMSSWNES